MPSVEKNHHELIRELEDLKKDISGLKGSYPDAPPDHASSEGWIKPAAKLTQTDANIIFEEFKLASVYKHGRKIIN